MGLVFPLTRVRPALISAAFLLLLATACGDEPKSKKSAAADAAGETTENAPPGALKLGVIVPQSGPLAAFGPPVAQAIQLAAGEVNLAGGVDGVPIELVMRDSKSTPEGGLEAATILSSDSEVRGIIGPLSSGVAEKVIEVVSQLGVATISPAATAPSLSDLDDQGTFFRTVPSDALQGRVMAQYAIDAGFTNAAVMYVDNAYGKNLNLVFKVSFETLGGNVLVSLPHEEEEADPDYLRDLEKIMAVTPQIDLLVLITYQAQGAQIITDKATLSAPGTLLLADGLRTEELSKATGSALLAGVRGTAPAQPTGPTYEAFRAAYAAKFGAEPSGFTAPAYDALYLFALAAAKAKSLDRAAILAQLGQVSGSPGEVVTPGLVPGSIPEGDVDFAGASGGVDWDEKGDPTSAIYELYEFQADGTILRIDLLQP